MVHTQLQIATGAVLLLPVRAVVLVLMLAAYIAIAWLLSLLPSGAGGPHTTLRAGTCLFLRVGFFGGGVRLHIRGKREVGLPSPSRVFRALTSHPHRQRAR
jgi:hypothetical protein